MPSGTQTTNHAFFPKRWIRAGAILIVAVLGVAPVALLTLGALQPLGLGPPGGLALSVRHLDTTAFGRALDLVGDPARLATNSLLVAAVAVPVTVLIASWTGLAVVLAGRRGRAVLLAAAALVWLVPAPALWVPRVVLFREIGLTDSLVALASPALVATTPFFVLLFAFTYARIPRSVLEAGRLAGLSPLASWRRLAVPLSRPTIFAVAMLAFTVHWSNHADALLLLTSPDQRTVPLGLATLSTLEPSHHPVLLAGALLATLPPIVVFALGHRAFLVRSIDL